MNSVTKTIIEKTKQLRFNNLEPKYLYLGRGSFDILRSSEESHSIILHGDGLYEYMGMEIIFVSDNDHINIGL